MSVFISIILLTSYIFLIFKFIGDLLKEIKALKIFYKVVFIFSLIIPGLLLAWILNDEQYIYYWDLSGYWLRAIDFTNMFFDKPFIALEEVYNTIRHSEYNYLANLLLAPINKVLGLSFPLYVFSVYLIYFIPVALLLSNLILITVENIKNRNIKLSLPFLCLLFTPFLIPIRFGFIDIIGLVFIFLILNLLVKSNFLRYFNYKKAIILGLLILILVFTRRWYAFWATSFYLSLFLTNFIISVLYKDWKLIKNTFYNLLIAGLVPLSIMLIFFYPFFEMSVLKDYGDIYSAYRSANLTMQFNSIIVFFGWGIIAFFFLGTFLQWKQNKSLLLFLIIGTLITIGLFTKINDFGGYQHNYLLLPLIAVFTLLGIINLSEKKKFFVVIFVGFLIINNVIAFTKFDTPNFIEKIFTSVDSSPKYRKDFYQVMDLAKDINKYSNQKESIYVLASSRILNDNIIKNSLLPESRQEFKNLNITQHVDKRDHFPNELFISKYVVVTDPPQFHLGENNQFLVGYFNNEILNGSLKKHYKQIKAYNLDNGITTYLMKKSQGLNNDEIQKIQDFFKSKYPDYPQMFNVNNTILKSSEIQLGDNYGNVIFENKQIIKIFPGDTKNSSVAFNIDENDKELEFIATFYKKNEIKNNCNPEMDGEIELFIEADGKLLKSLYVTHKKDLPISVNLRGIKTLKLSVSKGHNHDYCDFFMLKNIKFK